MPSPSCLFTHTWKHLEEPGGDWWRGLTQSRLCVIFFNKYWYIYFALNLFQHRKAPARTGDLRRNYISPHSTTITMVNPPSIQCHYLIDIRLQQSKKSFPKGSASSATLLTQTFIKKSIKKCNSACCFQSINAHYFKTQNQLFNQTRFPLSPAHHIPI